MAESSDSGRYACVTCSYAYDPRLGDPERGVTPGTRFEDLPADWRCPWCGAKKGTFVREADLMKDLFPGSGRTQEGTA